MSESTPDAGRSSMAGVGGRPRRTLSGIGAVLTALAGCADGGSGSARASGEGASNAPRVLEAMEAGLDVGQGTSSEEVFFTRIVEVLPLPSGQLLVADGGQRDLFLFDSLGQLVGRFGGSGEGPGELRGITAVHTCSDSVAVVGPFDVNLFDGSGAFGRRMRYRVGGVQRAVVGISSDCGSLMLRETRTTPALNTVGLVEYDIVGWTPGTGRREPITTVALMEAWMRDLDGAQRPFVLPWSGFPTTYAYDGRFLVVGEPQRPEVNVYRAGAAVSSISWQAQAEPVTMVDRQSYSREREEWSEGTPPEREIALLFPEIGEYPDLPSAKPFMEAIRIAQDGSVWVKRFPSDSFGPFEARFAERPRRVEEWMGFTADGALQSRVRFPLGFELRAVADGKAYGIGRDSLGVQSAQVWVLP